MKKRVLAALLCVAMAATLLVGCGGNPADGSEDSQSQAGSENPGKDTEKDTTTKDTEKDTTTGTENTGDAGKLSAEPVVYYPFESADEGWKVVVADASKAGNNAYDPANNTGSRGIIDGDMSLAKILEGGVAGNMISFNRDYALDLNFEPTNTKEWSVSFWVCHAGMTDFGPTLQFGSNMAYAADAGNKVAWLNVTAGHGNPYPVLWSRNEIYDGPTGVDCWPWMCGWDSIAYGQTEWAMITVVCSGEEQQSPIADGGTTVGAQLYINGELKYDSNENYNNGTYFEYTWDATMAPDLMIPAEGQTFEAYFGINYWDVMYKGYLDELYVFDKALTAEDVAALYAKGDATNPPTFDPNDIPKENPRVLLGENSVGANNYTQAWWTDWSDIYEVAEGTTKTITFKNYHTALNFGNYMNAAVILQKTPTGHSADTAHAAYAEGYAEYLVARLDNYAWQGAVNTGTEGHGLCTLESDWNWDTFADSTHEATVVLKVTNHGTTADIEMEITAKDGNVYHQSYKGIAVDGPVYACLTVEKACIDIISVE